MNNRKKIFDEVKYPKLRMDSASLADLPVDNIINQLLGTWDKPPDTQVDLAEKDIKKICMVSREIFLSQPMLLEICSPVNICGDIHGQFADLLRMFEIGGLPPVSNYLFLGDYVDRANRGIETISLLLCFKIKYPENFFILRGNHECSSINRIYGFYDECKRRYSIKLWKIFGDVFNCLPISAIVDDSIFCLHGGLSPSLTDLGQIANIQRPTDIPDEGLICDLLWADPDPDIYGFRGNDRGVSYVFGADVVDTFLRSFDLDLIARAHQVVEDGYEFFNNRTLVTIFSAPNYCGEFDNAGGMMIVREDLVCSFKILRPGLAEDYEEEVEGQEGQPADVDGSAVSAVGANVSSSEVGVGEKSLTPVPEEGMKAVPKDPPHKRLMSPRP